MKSLILITSLIMLSSNAFAGSKGCSTKKISNYKSSSSLKAKAEFYTCLLNDNSVTASLPYLIHLVSISRDSKFQDKYLSKVLDNMPREYEERLYKKLYKKRLSLSSKVKSDLMYFYALRSYDKGKTRTALKYLSAQQGTDFNRYAQSKFLKGVIYFQLNKINSAEAQFEVLTRGKAKAINSEIKEDITNASLLNLARIQIIKEDYKDAIESYRKVSFKDSKWFDGLIEMSWVMLSKEDYEGAIGNAEFVDKSTNPFVYKPWTPVIKSVGLLKMCQFPEANRSIEVFQTNYGKLSADIKSYVSKNLNKSWYSAAVATLEKRLSKSSIKKTPSIVFYAARDTKFISLQKRINALLDEEEALKDLKSKLRKSPESYAHNLVVKKLGMLDPVITNLENQAGAVFKDKLFATLDDHRRLEKIADIVDFEVFARSSNNITLRVAGAKFKDKMKKTNRKQSSWKYVGEFWTDEVGKFRSFVKNKCVDDTLNVSKK